MYRRRTVKDVVKELLALAVVASALMFFIMIGQLIKYGHIRW